MSLMMHSRGRQQGRQQGRDRAVVRSTPLNANRAGGGGAGVEGARGQATAGPGACPSSTDRTRHTDTHHGYTRSIDHE